MDAWKPLLVGFAFGWLLQKAGLSRYDRIVNVYRLRDLAVVKFMLSAVVTGAFGILALRALGFGGAAPIPTTLLAGNLIGGVIFGVGMALSGFCPGTIAAGAGEGRLDYLIAGSLGLYAGSVLFGLSYPLVMARLARAGNAGSITLPEWLHVDPWLFAVLIAELALLLFYSLERGRRRR